MDVQHLATGIAPAVRVIITSDECILTLDMTRVQALKAAWALLWATLRAKGLRRAMMLTPD